MDRIRGNRWQVGRWRWAVECVYVMIFEIKIQHE